MRGKGREGEVGEGRGEWKKVDEGKRREGDGMGVQGKPGKVREREKKRT